jgi:hypothetical protein
MVRREKLPEYDKLEARNTFAEDSDRIRRLFYPEPLQLPVTDVDEVSNSMKVSTTDPVLIDFTLLSLRRVHQTKQADSCARTHRKSPPALDAQEATKDTERRTQRQQIVREFHAIVKEEQDKREATGLTRETR